MNLRSKFAFLARRPKATGFTLVEMMVALGVGTAVVGSLVTLSITTSWNYTATANYVQMDDQSRTALDKIGKEIRNSTALLSFTSGSAQTLVFTNANASDSMMLSYNHGMLRMSKPGQATVTLLTGCDSFSFSLFNRVPLVNGTAFTFYASTNAAGTVDPTITKVVNMTWKCSRSILGSKLNTEIVQTAQIVLRNKVTE
jgi:Tfp pilus assembly protein PilW